MGFPEGDGPVSAGEFPPLGTTDSDGDPVEGGSYDANGVYVGATGSTSSGTEDGHESDDCGLIGLEFLIPLGLLGLFRRRR